MLKEYIEDSLKEKAALMLIVANILTFAFALIFHWSAASLILAYSLQTGFIIFFNFLRMIKLKRAFTLMRDTEELKYNADKKTFETNRDGIKKKQWIPLTNVGKIILIVIYAFVFGNMAFNMILISTVGLIFLPFIENIDINNEMLNSSSSDPHIGGLYVLTVLLAVVLFFVSHYISYRKKVNEDKNRDINIAVFFVIPFVRILPMAFIGILFIFSKGILGVLFFIIIKTIIDIISHNMEKSISVKYYDKIIKNSSKEV